MKRVEKEEEDQDEEHLIEEIVLIIVRLYNKLMIEDEWKRKSDLFTKNDMIFLNRGNIVPTTCLSTIESSGLTEVFVSYWDLKTGLFSDGSHKAIICFIHEIQWNGFKMIGMRIDGLASTSFWTRRRIYDLSFNDDDKDNIIITFK